MTDEKKKPNKGPLTESEVYDSPGPKRPVRKDGEVHESQGVKPEKGKKRPNF
jgi:hypothetical protein